MSSKNRTSLVANGLTSVNQDDLDFSHGEALIWNPAQNTPLRFNDVFPKRWRLHATGLYNFGGTTSIKFYYGQYIPSPAPEVITTLVIPPGHNDDNNAAWYLQAEISCTVLNDDPLNDGQYSLALRGVMHLSDGSGSSWFTQTRLTGLVLDGAPQDTVLSVTAKSDVSSPDSSILVNTVALEALN